ncbi:hypothetical protein MAIT1_02937 [Magnetofaba australis IT-1]|uniref:DUF2817 domain-containing protein n=1 Tax=Magnetofaba australis IT-1 TaxID=1434232 RepID=A0A1Y2K5M9_9PROT|nr:hypothetical protein MAIT1_02937 [Magnetofaba australis IT-1]
MQTAKAAGGAQASYVNPPVGLQGEELAMDVARWGSDNALASVVVLSATHGVEGPVGSAIQLDLLRHADLNALPGGVELIVVHGVNPYGYSWGRRANEDGVDLNRNFVDFSAEPPSNPGYDALSDALVPTSLEPDAIRRADARLAAYRKQHGEIAYDVAVAGGQYRHRHGLFYGGDAPSWSRQTLEQLWLDWGLAKRRLVAVLDLHTGIGPHGYGELICDLPPGGPGSRRALRWHGESVTHPALGDSVSGARSGLSDYGWLAAFDDRLSFLTLEFGTGPFVDLLAALRADHVCHALELAADDPQMVAAREQLQRFFNPPSPAWREMTLWRGRQVLRQTLQGVAASL